MDANKLTQSLHDDSHLHYLGARGNEKVWFSTRLLRGLPISRNSKVLIEQDIPMQASSYRTLQRGLQGWMSYWRHMGGNIYEAAAFMRMTPLGSGLPRVRLSLHGETTNNAEDFSQYYFGPNDEFYSSFITGTLEALKAPLSHPLADVSMEILNAIQHPVHSTAKAFELLSARLVEAMIVEMCRRGYISSA